MKKFVVAVVAGALAVVGLALPSGANTFTYQASTPQFTTQTPADSAPWTAGSAHGSSTGELDQCSVTPELLSCDVEPAQSHTLTSYSNQVYSTINRVRVQIHQGNSPLNGGNHELFQLQVRWSDGTTEVEYLGDETVRDGDLYTFEHRFTDIVEDGSLRRSFQAELVHINGEINYVAAVADLDPLYDLTFSPLQVRTIENCDWFGKGDFTFMWYTQDGTMARKDRDLGKGQNYTVWDHARTLEGMEQPYSTSHIINPLIIERDFSITRVLIQIAGLIGAEFKGGSGGQLLDVGTHEYDGVVDTDVEWLGWSGLGDGGCQIERTFTVDVDYAIEFRS